MTKEEFISRIYNTPCESCPIRLFCRNNASFSCHSTARQYYNIASDGKGVVKWLLQETALSLD